MIGDKRGVVNGQIDCPKKGKKVRWSDCRTCYDNLNMVWKKDKTEAPDHVVCGGHDASTSDSVAD